MADLSAYLEDFDDRSVAASTGIPDPVPPGEYDLFTDSAEVVPTKAGTGIMLKVAYTIGNGEYEGRKVFAQFNIRNASAQAQAIGIGELKALCLATGVDYEIVRTDTDALLYQPFAAMVGMEKQQINPQTGQPYAPRNRVIRYLPRSDAPPARQQAQQPAQQPATKPAAAPAKAPARNTMKPWEKGGSAFGR
jgi:hypothetical protein